MRLVKSLLERCTEVMAQLAIAPAGVSELAAALDMPKSATHRLLQELRRLDWVRQLEDGRYAATLRFALLGRDVLAASGLPDLAQPLLDRLAVATHELVRLTIATESGLSWLAFAQGAAAGLVYQPTMAGPVLLHATANGKAFLATLDDATAVRLAGATLKAQPTPHTLTTVKELVAALAEVRACGYGLADEEAEQGVAAVAVAIRPGPGPATGTLSVAGPKIRMPAARIPALVAALADTATALARLPPFRFRKEPVCA